MKKFIAALAAATALAGVGIMAVGDWPHDAQAVGDWPHTVQSVGDWPHK
ncbi:hypothetical protein [Arthrobacter sp. KK5.5]